MDNYSRVYIVIQELETINNYEYFELHKESLAEKEEIEIERLL